MINPNSVETVEDLIDEANEVQTALKAGTLSNTVARTLLHAIRIKLDGFKTNMAASSLGCDIKDHALHARNRQSQRRAA